MSSLLQAAEPAPTVDSISSCPVLSSLLGHTIGKEQRGRLWHLEGWAVSICILVCSPWNHALSEAPVPTVSLPCEIWALSRI